MLPEDTEARRKALAENLLRQSSVNDHFKPALLVDKPQPYSDQLFKEAAIEWLIATNQVLVHSFMN
jgi:hypothetical protein